MLIGPSFGSGSSIIMYYSFCFHLHDLLAMIKVVSILISIRISMSLTFFTFVELNSILCCPARPEKRARLWQQPQQQR